MKQSRFFQTKAIPPSLWSAYKYVLQFNLKLEPFGSSANTAADFLSRLELTMMEEISVKIQEDVQTTLIEVITSSSDVADKKQSFFTQRNGEDEREEQMVERKEQSRRRETEWVANEELPSMKPSITEFKNVDGSTTSYSLHAIKAISRTRVEQNVDPVSKNVKLKMLGQPYDEVLLTTDRQFKHHKASEDRIILKDGLLFRKKYWKTGNVKHYQILIPKQIVDKVLWSLNGELGNHSGIARTIKAYGEKYYYPNMRQLSRKWIMSSKQCIEESRIRRRLIRPPLQNPIEALQHQKMQCKLICYRNYFCPVALGR